MAQDALVGPFGERHFGHQLGGHVMHAARIGPRRAAVERALPAFAPAQVLMHPFQHPVAETRADPAAIDQPAALIVVTQHERAEARARAARIGVAGDDELLAPAALELDPRSGPPFSVRGIGLLADDALQTEAAGVVEDFVAAAAHMIAEADAALPPGADQQPPHELLALELPRAPQIVSIQVQQVEDVIAQLGLFPLAGKVLQLLKAADALFIEDDHFAVEQRVVDLKLPQRRRNRFEPGGPVLPVAREEPRATVLEARQDAVAVVLDFVQPAIAARRLRHERR
ncbi:MAG: hypothetical protein BWZ08_02421 [candidate division BRC1 bacterium ADurb.BinA292]|nr:MAG: hypothetical protein BWZ08_02421 [candidate division BRC1 bacterium ADurb.BinA292]